MDKITEKIKQIRLIIFDVDGVFTNGKLYYSDSGGEIKAFHVHDGLGVKRLMAQGIEVAVITARQSSIVERRMKELGVQHIYQGERDKNIPYQSLIEQLNLKESQVAYMGDDLPDLPLIERSGLGITVPNATQPVREIADWQTQKPGGEGAVREVCDLICASIK